MATHANTKTSASIEVGDRVRFRLGTRDVEGTVVEDRGRIGVRGRRLLRVVVLPVPQEPPFELPADDVVAIG
jgi:hypothetical protein